MFIVNPMPKPVTAELIDRLMDTSTGTIGHFRDAGFMDCGMIARMAGAKVAGTAVTVRVTVPDSVIGHYALKDLRPGDILVIERGADQHTACWGGMTSAAAAKLGVRAVIIDGAGHDIAVARAAGLPIWCRRITPITTKHRGLGGAINVPISCGGVAINPGDAILADENGVLVLPRGELEEVLTRAIAFEQRKAAIFDRIATDSTFSVPEASGAARIVEAALAAQSS